MFKLSIDNPTYCTHLSHGKAATSALLQPPPLPTASPKIDTACEVAACCDCDVSQQQQQQQQNKQQQQQQHNALPLIRLPQPLSKGSWCRLELKLELPIVCGSRDRGEGHIIHKACVCVHILIYMHARASSAFFCFFSVFFFWVFDFFGKRAERASYANFQTEARRDESGASRVGEIKLKTKTNASFALALWLQQPLFRGCCGGGGGGDTA